MSSVFLSYSSKDQEFVDRLADDLKLNDFDVWYDRRQLDSYVGSSLLEKIQEGIKQASWLVVVLSPNATESKWVKEELNFGLARQLAEGSVFVLPILYKDTEIPAFLHDKIYADFRIDYHKGLRRLIATLRREYFDSNLIKPVSTLTPDTGIDFKELIKAKGFNCFSGMWRGLTGCLELLIEGELVEGKYDWQGYNLSGYIKGTIRSDIPINAIVFNWLWMNNGEMGKGIFYLLNPEILFGGWWMNYEFIDPNELLTKSAMPPNHWVFLKDNLSLDQKVVKSYGERHGESSMEQKLFDRMLEIRSSRYGQNHPAVAGRLDDYGSFFLRRGEYDKAAKFVEEAIKAVTKQPGEEKLTLDLLTKLYEEHLSDPSKEIPVKVMEHQRPYYARIDISRIKANVLDSLTHKDEHSGKKNTRSDAQKQDPAKKLRAHRPRDKRFRKGRHRGKR